MILSDSGQRKTDRPADCRADLRSYLTIGQITAPHGITGEVRVFPMTDRIDRFEMLTECLLSAPDEGERRLIRILSTRQNLPFILVRIEGVEDRTAAEKLRGKLLSVDRAHAIALPEGSHFICDLIGLTVTDTEHGVLGQLTDILQHTAHDVYTVSSPGLPDLLFPAIKAVIHRVDLDSRLIEVTLPNGLYEIYRPARKEQ